MTTNDPDRNEPATDAAGPAYPPPPTYPPPAYPSTQDGAPPAPPGYAPPPQAPAPPGYATPPYGVPGSPGYTPYQPYPPRPSTGTVSWALGFLFLIPSVGVLIAAIVMPSIYPAVSKKGDIARGNARGAANWGLTAIVGIVVGVLTSVIIYFAGATRGFFPTGIGFLLVIAVGITHIVVTIIGTVRSSQGRVFEVPFAIPFIRR